MTKRNREKLSKQQISISQNNIAKKLTKLNANGKDEDIFGLEPIDIYNILNGIDTLINGNITIKEIGKIKEFLALKFVNNFFYFIYY